jgi:hypothetical protein
MARSFLEADAPRDPADDRRPWPAFLIGGVLVVAAIGVIWFFSRDPHARTGAAPPPYAAQLQVQDVKMATAQNFMGATVTYIEGQIVNTGDKTVTHAVADVTFRNAMDQVVQHETLPIRVLEDRPGYQDAVDLSLLPLAPAQARHFRLTFEHVSADWNQQYPALTIVDVSTK